MIVLPSLVSEYSHAPGNFSNVAACFHSRYSLVLGAHKINLTLNVEMLGVTSVAGFESHPGAGSTWTR